MQAHPDSLFTRRQIVELTGVPEGVLAFWIREGLLIPTRGGEGRGSHRRFSRMQVSFAAIFGQLQQYGLNIGRLRPLSVILQRGIEVCERENLSPSDLQMAVILANDLARFRSGENVYVDDREHGRPTRRIVATSEHQISFDVIEESPFRASIIAFASALDPGDFQAVEMFAAVRSETYGLALGDFSWLLWQDENGGWYASEQTGPGDGFSEFPSADTGIYLAVGKILRRVWGFDLEERRRHRHAAHVASLLQHSPVLFEQLISRGFYDEADRELAQIFIEGKA